MESTALKHSFSSFYRGHGEILQIHTHRYQNMEMASFLALALATDLSNNDRAVQKTQPANFHTALHSSEAVFHQIQLDY
jgi:hypothetical protein